MDRRLKIVMLLIVVSTAISFAGVYLAYHGPWISSDAWRQWGNDQAWIADVTRLLFLSVLATFLVSVSFLRRCDEVPDSYCLKLDYVNIPIFAVFLAVVSSLNFYYYPPHFEAELLKNRYGYLSSGTIKLIQIDYFGQVYKPYFAYFFYSFGLWCGIIMPTFSIFIKGFITDSRKVKRFQDRIESYPAIEQFLEKHAEDAKLDSLNAVLSDLGDLRDGCQHSLRNLSQRYLPAIFLVFISHVLGSIVLAQGGEFAGAQDYVSTMTVEARSSNSWVILIYIVICIGLVSYFSYLLSNYLSVLEKKLGELRLHVSSTGYSYEYKEAVKAREVDWTLKEKNIISYVYETIFKSGSIYIPLLASLALLCWQYVVIDHMDVLLPKTISDWIKETFLRQRI